MRNATVLLTALALAACAELRWQKAGADPETLGADIDACRALAQERVGRAIGPAVLSRPDPRFGSDTSQPGPADRLIQEQTIAERCMRDKGYSLVPADK